MKNIVQREESAKSCANFPNWGLLSKLFSGSFLAPVFQSRSVDPRRRSALVFLNRNGSPKKGYQGSPLQSQVKKRRLKNESRDSSLRGAFKGLLFDLPALFRLTSVSQTV